MADAGLVGGLPAVIAAGGAGSAYADIFLGSYDNEHTRRAYKRHVDRFLV